MTAGSASRPVPPAPDGPAAPGGPAGSGGRSGRGRRRAPGRPRRALAAGGVAALAALLGVTLAVRGGAAPACAAAPRALPAPHPGKATFYDSQGGGGNCSRPAPPADRHYVALGPQEYAAGAACGGYLDVTGPKGTVRVLVMDQCPECEPGHLDLSAEAFARIADPVRGVVDVRYRAVLNPPLPGPLTFRIKEGSSQWWFAVLVGDHGNPLRSVEVRQGAGWRAATRQDYNYWLIDSGAGPGPYTLRVTDTAGHRAVATGIRLRPGQVQRSTVRMYGGSTTPTRSAAPSRTPTRTPGPTTSPRPSVAAPGTTPQVRDAALAPPVAAQTRPTCG
ncbi:expansin EXLX1 family cellulose-binding protein [Micromonospora auratinigra]|uniref:Peptidoglycan-binding domain-containing protein, expansin n=1 Tax=Micromonospora auratinigra TaxID=261654 RepID=A0A1A9A8C0_9ACTN|nr:expansin EXLX1 family cellulose-binding protein [Micromonospora auratinigra]SBT52726.1 Peptidoglycan-binding domain-containing protein, expansin [Micromonospora auratinigra]